jgi:hypothetical protein
MKSARETVGQLSMGRKYATIITASGKRRLDAKTSKALRRANLSEKQLGEILDAQMRRELIKLVPVKVMLPAELVAIGPQIADSVGRLRMDQVLADCLHDYARDAGLPTAVKDREEFAPLYDQLG